MLKIGQISIILFLTICVNGQFSVFLIGDAGNDVFKNKTLHSLEKKILNNPASMVFFLGYNIYPQGLDGSPTSEKKLLNQLNIFKNYDGEWFFIPGNHDWNNGKWKGYDCIIRQQNFIEDYARDSISDKVYKYEHFYPKEGMPGPILVEKEDVCFLITDTDWWLHRQFFHKVGKNSSYSNMEKHYLQRLDSLCNDAKVNNKKIVFIGHHPLKNYGVHGQSRQPWMFLVNYTPFQIFGLLGVNRALMSELRQPRYSRMAKKILKVLDKHGPYIAVAGHEHNLQYIFENQNVYLISGSGSKLSKLPASIQDIDSVKFYASKQGFMELRFNNYNQTALIVYDENGEVIYQIENVMIGKG